MKRTFLTIITTLIALTSVFAQDNIYSFKVKDASDKEVSLADYKGKVLLVVNTATKCGFTPQYAELQAFYEKYHDAGFEILDFPCNQFGGQAPGTMAEIRDFCTGTYNTTFPQFMKIDVNGDNADPLFKWLYARKGFEGFGTGDRAAGMDRMMKGRDADYASKPEIKWNFTKFLVDRNGYVVARFEPTMDMSDVEKAVSGLL